MQNENNDGFRGKYQRERRSHSQEKKYYQQINLLVDLFHGSGLPEGGRACLATMAM